MIFDATTLRLPLTLEADLCIVGSGPGGASVAALAAEAGLSVVVLEAGAFVTPAKMSQREEEMFPELLWESGARSSSDRRTKILQGHGVGGSSLHNLNLCKRIPEPILRAWATQHRLQHLPLERWSALYDEVEALLGVAPVPEPMISPANELLRRGARALGWRHAVLQHNRTGCVGSGFCELGCAYDAKNNAAKVLIPRAVRAGAEVLTRAQAVRVLHDGKTVHGIEAVAVQRPGHAAQGRITVRASRVCLAASATGTAALLLRSEVPDDSGTTGQRLHLHPAVIVAGELDEPVRAWQGIPQSIECTEHFRPDESSGGRVWIIPAFAHPIGAATLLPGYDAGHAARMARYAHLGVLTAVLHDETKGAVRPRGELGVAIDYPLTAGDEAELARGSKACAQLLDAAGAKNVVELGTRALTAVHPMSTVPMDDDPDAGAVDSRGAHHQVRGLWVADGSLFPTSIGGPPQLSIYALGHHVGRALLAEG